MSLEEELSVLLNKYSAENGSNTPDFILADYLSKCLDAYNSATMRRDDWYGVVLSPGSVQTKHGKSRGVSEWISVEDRLPAAEHPVLACGADDSDVEMDVLSMDDDRWENSEGEER